MKLFEKDTCKVKNGVCTLRFECHAPIDRLRVSKLLEKVEISDCNEINVTIAHSVCPASEYYYPNFGFKYEKMGFVGNVQIPESVKVNSYSVEEEYLSFKDIDGNLYSRDGTVFVKYANAKSDTSFKIPDGVKAIDFYAFEYAANLKEIILPEGLCDIRDYAFKGCENLVSISFPESLTKVGEYAFENCVNLARVSINSKLDEISENAFFGCKSIEAFEVSEKNDTYKAVDDNLYSKNEKRLFLYTPGKKDTSYTIPKGVKYINTMAFANAANLTSLTIPTSVQSIGNYAFENCHNLTISCMAYEKPQGWSEDWSCTNMYNRWITHQWARQDCTVIFAEKVRKLKSVNEDE